MEVPSTDSQVPRSKRRRLLRGCLAILLVLCVAELLCRNVIGLGRPVLYVADEKIQFYPAPSHAYRRFGHTIAINSYSMRAPEFSQRKATENELRVLVIGDSVVFGGSQVDQADVCTSIAQRALAHDLQKPVVVGNISAGSWRLTNMDEFIKRFGTFDADVMILVLSQHDYAHLPRHHPFTDTDPDFPSHSPLLALQELVGRYGVRYVRHWLHLDKAQIDNLTAPASAADIAAGMAALRDIITTAQSRDIRVAVLQHLQTSEFGQPEKPGHALIKSTAESLGVPVIQLEPAFKAAMQRGEQPYRDVIHPTATGQAILADAIVHEVEKLVNTPATRP